MGYPSDLTDEQWESIKHLFETWNRQGAGEKQYEGLLQHTREPRK